MGGESSQGEEREGGGDVWTCVGGPLAVCLGKKPPPCAPPPPPPVTASSSCCVSARAVPCRRVSVSVCEGGRGEIRGRRKRLL